MSILNRTLSTTVDSNGLKLEQRFRFSTAEDAISGAMDNNSELACAPSYAPVSALERLGHDHVPPLDAVLAESFHDLSERSKGLYGTAMDPAQQPTVAGGLIHSRERQGLQRILDLPAAERSPEEVKLVVDLLTRCLSQMATPRSVCWQGLCDRPLSLAQPAAQLQDRLC